MGMKMVKTDYPGVFYILGRRAGKGQKQEKIYYIVYRRGGKLINEKAGKQFKDDMTPARAAGVRANRMEGRELTNEERREAERQAKKAEETRWTLSKLWDYYETQKELSKSIYEDKLRFKKYLEIFGDKEPQEISQFEIDKLRLTLLKRLKPQSVKHVLSLLKRIIAFGSQRNLCTPLPFKVEVPKVNNLVTEFLTQDELKNLFQAIKDSGDTMAGNAMLLALYTGMRRGEILKLRWDDIDLEQGFIHIRAPKGGKDAKIPLNGMARDVLSLHPRVGKFVFCYDDGTPFKQMNRAFRRIRDAAGIGKNFRPMHGLRHTFASLLASTGDIDLYTLQKLLTHKNPQMTARYSHLRDQTLQDASEKMTGIVERALHDESREVVRTGA